MEEGVCLYSHALHTARSAGLPPSLLRRAGALIEATRPDRQPPLATPTSSAATSPGGPSTANTAGAPYESAASAAAAAAAAACASLPPLPPLLRAASEALLAL